MSLYNTVEYPGFPFPQTHPDRLATIAALYGLTHAPIERCRVLEIGCGDGGNLIPMAVALPNSTFVGIDLAATAIATGQRLIAELGLTNIRLHAADLMTVDAAWGEFDYILTHGLYAWVPGPVREQILKVSRQNLSPDGIVYVSYNTLPGCRIRQMLRDMMLFHAEGFEEPGERIEQARALLGFITGARVKPNAYQRGVEEEIALMLAKAPWSLFHDELGDTYEPVYFHQFMQAAERHGLQFVAEADFTDQTELRLTPEAIAQVDRMAGDDRILREQYADFAHGRMFRQTVLCRADRPIDFPPRAARLASLYVSTEAAQVQPGEFVAGKNARLKTDHPGALAAMARLIAAAPQALPVAEMGIDPAILLKATLSGVTMLHTRPHTLVATPTPYPVASPLARWQAAHGLALSTLCHTSVVLPNPEDLRLLALLDGTLSLDEMAGLPGGPERLAHFGRLGLLIS